MEAKDPPSASSSSSSSPAAAMDGSPDDDVGIALAKEAVSHFQSKRFAECADVLSQILHRKPADPAVLHNVAVTEFLKDGSSNPKKLLEALSKFKLTPAGSNGITSIPSSKGSGNNSLQPSAASSTYEDDFDTSIVTVNKAVIMYHLREYDCVLLLLESLYQNLEPIDEITALRVCLILLDVALASRDASRAAGVILYLERVFGVGSVSQGDTGTVAQHVPIQTSKVSTMSSGLAVFDANVPFSSATGNTLENPPAGGDDSVEYDKLMSTLGSSGENSEHPSSSTEISKASMDSLGSANDLKLELQLFKVRLLLLTRNPKVAKREIKLAMNMARGRDSSMALLLKSQVEFARGNYRKAIILLMTCSNKPEAGLASMFNNNLGCVYHRLGDHALSLVYFTRALRSSCVLNSDKQLKQNLFSQDKSLFIFYNCAMQYLASEKPLLAAKCLHKATPVLSNQPVLWLRLAECCIMAAKKGLLQPSDGFDFDEAKITVVGNGNCRHLLLESKSGNRTFGTLAQDGSIGDDHQCRLSLPFARQCLWTALYLLYRRAANLSNTAGPQSAHEQDDPTEAASAGLKNSNQKPLHSTDFRGSSVATSAAGISSDTKENRGNVNPNAALLQSSVSAYEDMLSEDNRMIKQAVLADLAYVELCLENPLKALRAAETLEELPGCSKLYVFLSRVYGAEALCQLNRLKDAAELLSIYLCDNNSVDLPYSDTAREKWSSEKSGDGEDLNSSTAAQNAMAESGIQCLKAEEARGLLYVAFATMNAMKGDLKQAVWFVTKALSVIPNNPRALLAAVYLDILLGKTQDALAKLKQCSHVRFYRGTVTLSSSQ